MIKKKGICWEPVEHRRIPIKKLLEYFEYL